MSICRHTCSGYDDGGQLTLVWTTNSAGTLVGGESRGYAMTSRRTWPGAPTAPAASAACWAASQYGGGAWGGHTYCHTAGNGTGTNGYGIAFSYNPTGSLTNVDYPVGTTDRKVECDALNLPTKMLDAAGKTTHGHPNLIGTGDGKEIIAVGGPWSGASDGLTVTVPDRVGTVGATCGRRSGARPSGRKLRCAPF